ncbi:MAG: lipopolysaccharide biosynthesis protein [Polaribacter sp.]|uniref:lipopolysaccharide biosynthesis protein n=1 Tax=Polaribacter sp. TaxID=1920175 RepID=UPI003EF833F0
MNQVKAGAFLSFVLVFLNNVIKLLYTPFLIRSLGQSEFGLYSLAAATIGYLSIMDLGFGNAIIRFTSKYRSLKDKNKENNLYGMFIIIYIILGILVALSGTVLYYSSEMMFGNTMSLEELSRMKILIILLTFNLAVSFPFTVYKSIIIAHEKFVFSKLIMIGQVLINPLIMIPLLFFGYKSIALVVVMTILNLVVSIVNLVYCKTKIGVSPNYGFFDKDLLKEIGGYSFYIFLEGIVNQIYWSTGQFILGSVGSTVMIAVYSVALTFKGLYFSLSTSLVGVLLPRVTKLVVQNITDFELSKMFIRIGRLQFLILSFILANFIFFGQKFIELWAGEEYSESYMMALWILIPLTIPLIQNLGITILQAKDEQKFRVITYVLIAITNVFISIPAAKEYGGLGCAIVTGSSLLLGNGLIMNIYYHSKIKLNILNFWKEIGKMSLPILLLMFLFFGAQHVLEIEYSLINYLSQMIVFSILFIFTIWIFGMNDYEKNIFKNITKKITRKSV